MSTNVTAIPSPSDVFTFFDTARNEHIPKKNANIMLSTNMDLKNRFIIVFIFYFLFLFKEPRPVCPYHASQEDERHGRHCHHTVVDISEVINCIGQNLESEERTSAEELPHSTYDDEDHGIAQSVAHTVDETGPGLVYHGEGLKASHKNTVGDDKSHIHRELHAHVVGKSL